MRENYKKRRGGWVPEDSQALADLFKELRRSGLDMALLDMPGGIHRGVPTPIRIPDDCREMFLLVDRFIILSKDEAARSGWEQALDRLGIADRIMAVVRPSPDDVRPEVLPRTTAPGPPYWAIHLLDRSRVATLTLGVESLADYVAAFSLPEVTAPA